MMTRTLAIDDAVDFEVN